MPVVHGYGVQVFTSPVQHNPSVSRLLAGTELLHCWMNHEAVALSEAWWGNWVSLPGLQETVSILNLVSYDGNPLYGDSALFHSVAFLLRGNKSADGPSVC